MPTIRHAAVTVFLTLGLAFLATAQAADDQACGQTVQANCTKCHGANKICAKLDQADTDWKKTVAIMGQRGKLSQEVREAVVACLTSTGAKKLVCDK